MGLIKAEYTDKTTGITLKPAYAKITRMFMEKGDEIQAYFGISNTRELLETNEPINEIPFACVVDKAEDKIFSEIYIKAKEELFADWQDDIVE